MSKSKRLMELIMAVNRKRRFTAGELAREFGVSVRTILRDLQALSELGVPLYSETGPHGGYRILRESVLPPIAFTEEEAAAVFFAAHALRHYSSLPFEAELSAVLAKLYHGMSQTIRERIDRMRDRVDIVAPTRRAKAPYLSLLLDAAVRQLVVRIEYESRSGGSCRDIQPVGIYASGGLWYCPAYCFERRDIRLFRCDRVARAEYAPSAPVDLTGVRLDGHAMHARAGEERLALYAELDKLGVQRCEGELWLRSMLRMREDGTGWLEGEPPAAELPFLADFFISLGREATVRAPAELLDEMRGRLAALAAHYAFEQK